MVDALPETLPTSPRGSGGVGDRFALVTALRGMAAMWVVLFHLWTSEPSGVTHLPRWVEFGLFRWGHLGVPVFFALSGFVIAHSISNRTVDGAEVTTFLRRRYLRIAPPYYVAIVVVLAVGWISSRVEGEPLSYNGAPLTLGRLLASFGFLQEFLGIPNLEEVFWTLCYEMGFYVVMIVVLFALHRRGRSRWLGPVAAVSGWGSVVVYSLVPELTHWLYLTKYWFMFAAGIVAYEAARHRCRPAWLWPLVGAMIVVGVWRWWGAPVVAALTTAALHLDATRAGSRRWSVVDLRAVAFLGTISYSLYLFHAPIRSVVLFGWREIAGEPTSAITAIGLYATQTAAAIAGAWIMWRLVERPSMAWASRQHRR
jgi:peptidoglycan/LPS O-acetylase OafA/YrhL